MDPPFCNFSEVKVCKGCISYKVFKNFQKSYQFFQTNWEWLYQPSRLIFSSHGYCNVINLTSFECFQDKDSKCIFIEKLIFFDLIPSKKIKLFSSQVTQFTSSIRKLKFFPYFPIMTWLDRTERFLSTKTCLMTEKTSLICFQQNHPLNVMLFGKNRVHALGTFVFSYFNYVLGAYGYCTTSGTKILCRDTFLDKDMTLEIQVKACRRPAKIGIVFYILGQTFRKELEGSQNIPLPGVSIGSFSSIVLNVFADPLDVIFYI